MRMFGHSGAQPALGKRPRLSAGGGGPHQTKHFSSVVIGHRYPYTARRRGWRSLRSRPYTFFVGLACR